MNYESSPEGQVETALDKVIAQREKSEASQHRELLKLTGGLRRIDFYVSEKEYFRLCDLCGGGTVETLLEAFVADMARSERSIWKQCQIEAGNWQAAHRRAELAERAFFEEWDAEEGGKAC